MKLIMSVAVVGICALIGYERAAGLSGRIKWLNAALLMLEKVQACLKYEKMTTAELVEWLSEYESLKPLRFLPVCRERSRTGLPFPEAWKEALKEERIPEDDRKMALQIGEVLGSTEAENQISELMVLRSLLEQNKQQAEEEKTQKSKLYHSLGVLSGIVLAIMIW